MLRKLFSKLTGANATKMVIVIRTDIAMGKGKAASQAAHAAVSLYASAMKSADPHLEDWLRWGQPKVILKCDSNAALLDTYRRAVAHDLNACKIFDAGRTQVEHGTLTAIGIGPAKVEDVDKITGELKLL